MVCVCVCNGLIWFVCVCNGLILCVCVCNGLIWCVWVGLCVWCVCVCVRVESVYLQVGSCLHMCVQGAGWGVLHSLANVSACVVVVYWYLCFCMRERERMTALIQSSTNDRH